MDKEVLLSNIDKVHTTEMGIDRIKKNLKKLWHFCYGCGKIGVWKFW